MFKKIVFLLILVLVLFVGCPHKTEVVDDEPYEIISSFDLSIDTLAWALSPNDNDKKAELIALFTSWAKPVLIEDLKAHCSELKKEDGSPITAEEIEANISNKTQFFVKRLQIKYPTTGYDGKKIKCSALIYIPYAKIVFSWDGDKTEGKVWYHYTDNVILHNHGTVAKDSQCPTNSSMYAINEYSLLLKTAFMGNLVINPDYEGYGASSNRIHPYLVQEPAAKVCVDAIRAVFEWKKVQNRHGLEDNFKLYSFGYSQGSTVTLGVHNYIENNNLIDELHFEGSLCGDGSYDHTATYNYFLNDDNGGIYMPSAILLILRGYLSTYKNSYLKGFKVSDFLNQTVCKALKDGTKNEWELIDSKKYSTDEIEAKIVQALAQAGIVEGTPQKLTASQMFNQNALDKNSAPAKALCRAFEDNNYTKAEAWKNGYPIKPILAVHHEADEVCPFVNFTNLYDLSHDKVKRFVYDIDNLKESMQKIVDLLPDSGWGEDRIDEAAQLVFANDGSVHKSCHPTGGVIFYAANVFSWSTFLHAEY